MPKRSREDWYAEESVKKLKKLVVSHKRKNEDVHMEPRKRQRHITEDYITRLENDNRIMREACMEAGESICQLQNKVKQLEMLLSIQRSQMERFRVTNDIAVY